jgi:hypothetical protein
VTAHLIRCRCGSLEGELAHPRDGNRVVCYCRDCQAFVHYLGNASQVLDTRAGSDIVQVLPKNLSFTRGSDQLACLRLRPKGLLRWYAGCCRTPIGNTLATPKLSFIGLLHCCLGPDHASLDGVFGPVTAWVHTGAARGEPKPPAEGTGKTVGWFIRTTLRARINGEWRRTPLFRSGSSEPVAVPHVLSADELARVMQAVQDGSA